MKTVLAVVAALLLLTGDQEPPGSLLYAYSYSQDYLDFMDVHGIIPCDTDTECEDRNPHLLEPAGPPAE